MIVAGTLAGCGSSGSSTPTQNGLSFDGANPSVGYHRVANGPTLHVTGSPIAGFSAANSSYRAQVVNLWANFCTVCKEEAPVLRAAYHSLNPRGVQFLGVETEAKTDASNSLAHGFGWTWPEFADQQGITLFSLKFPSLPVTVITNSKGVVTGFFGGAIPSVAALSTAVHDAES